MDDMVKEESLEFKTNTKFVDEFSKEVYEQTYRYGLENINQTQLRVAKDLASIEIDKDYWTKKFLWALEDFKFSPGGRITSNAGTGLKGTTYINCFVDGFMGEDQDSMEGILDTLKRQALILKSEGGYGFCADVMRPRGSFINGIGNESPGAVRMLDMWDTQSGVITEGSGLKTKNEKGKVKIRKGAQMVTMSCWHPDIEEYITAKQTPGRLTKFNMSVLITDEFMYAVKNNKSWSLEFPDYNEHPVEYKKHWDGNIKKWKSLGFKTTISKTYDDANQLWDIIMTSTYNKNEPGVLFVDVMNKLNNLSYCEYITATNPCGEQILPIGGVCLLGSINLTQFIDFENKNWDFDKLKKLIPIAVRFMDNVNDKTNVPLPSQKESLINKRRIGLGILGYGSALMMLKMKYGSPEALKITEKLMKFICNQAYQASSMLAKEKGSFPLFEKEKYLNSFFIKQALDPETIDMIRKNGIRNSHLLSIQPTGNSSVFANNVSGGLEPLFMPKYIRTSIMPYAPEGLDKPKNIDWTNKTFTSNSIWIWIKEGDENLLRTEFDGYVWKFDKSRGLLRENVVKDYAVRFLESKNQWDEKAEWAATTTELSITEHINTMSIMSKYIDSAMSKTINLPNEYTFENFKNLYMDMYDTGTIKGGTTYRAGTMTTVLAKDSSIIDDDKFHYHNAPKRPKELPCEVFQITAKGKKWTIVVGLYDGKPYECFGIEHNATEVPENFKKGFLSKEGKGKYTLKNDKYTINDVTSNMTDEEESLTRMISTALRHGSSIDFIVEQLNKSNGTVVSYNKAIGRVLSKYAKALESNKVKCVECGSDNVSFEENCFKCYNCGSSKCQ